MAADTHDGLSRASIHPRSRPSASSARAESGSTSPAGPRVLEDQCDGRTGARPLAATAQDHHRREGQDKHAHGLP